MTLDLPQLLERMHEQGVQNVIICSNGNAQAVRQFGTLLFPECSDLVAWVETGLTPQYTIDPKTGERIRITP